MTMRATAAALMVAVLLAGCAATPRSGPDATPEQVAKAAYVHKGPPAITLYTMINNRTGAGAHTSMMINASQRVIFDPAGNVRLSIAPEIGDVLYGVTPQVEDWYERAHARETFHVRIQRLEVSAESAERALRLVQASGAVPGSMCTSATAGVLSQLPEFGGVSSVLFPNKLAEQVAALPGVSERRLRENDSDDKALATAAVEAQLAK